MKINKNEQIEWTDESKPLLRDLLKNFKMIQELEQGNEIAEIIDGLVKADYEALRTVDFDALRTVDFDPLDDEEIMNSAFYQREVFTKLTNKIRAFCSQDNILFAAYPLSKLLFGNDDPFSIGDSDIEKLEAFLNEGESNDERN